MAYPPPSPSSFPLLLYLSLHFSLSLHYLISSALARDPHAAARATLSLISALSLLPAYHSLRSSAATPRYGVLALFISALVPLIAAVLRLLAALEALSDGDQRTVAIYTALLQTTLSVSCVAVLRSLPAVVSLNTAAPRWLKIVTASARPKRRGGAKPVLLGVLLHAVEGAIVSSLELFAAVVAGGGVTAFVVTDIVAAVAGIWLAVPLLRLSLRVLLQATEGKLVAVLQARCEKLLQVEGVLRYVNLHVWEETVGFFVGTVCVVVRKGVETKGVLEMAVDAFDGVVHDLTVQVETCQTEADVAVDKGRVAG